MNTRTPHSTDTREPWRRRAVITTVWSSAIALALLIASTVIAWSWREELPDPVASHWNGGSVPDAVSGLAGFLATMGITGIGCLVLFDAIALFMGRTAGTLRMAAAGNVWMAGLLATLTAGSLAPQRGLADAHQVALPGWLLPLALLAPLVPAVIAAILVPADRRRPATTAVPAGAPRIPLGEAARAVWLRRVSGGPGAAIAVGSILLIVVLSIVLNTPGVLALVAVLVLVLGAMLAFQVRVDATGLTARSLLGWPRTRIRADEVERASVIDVSPFRDFGGWGWRVGHGGRTGIVLRAGEALLVEQSGGRSLVITVDDAEQGAALLNTMAARARDRR
ncbi:hypothetical protein [Acidipropionibacterium virtanenii]|uniref:DUF1648 domain-containing protein n=1 Tax=Acidipropionibacterium virtanenii TaxID=2057246 RepID=A0A344UWY2_9ACTN|nr:hypothetical protein [Acidipropionibacterium virtanenii]AXE39780.1 hypothetical protein JS278_02643 [Acidipropionibacterium virtanenii]